MPFPKRKAMQKYVTSPPFVLFILALLVYNANYRISINHDTIPASLVPVVLIKNGNLVMDEFQHYFSESNLIANQYFFQETRWGFLPAYPVATGVLLAPLYFFPVYAYDRADRTPADWFQFATVAQRISASFLSALSVSLFCLLALQLGASRKLATVLSGAYALGTEAWSISSQGLWQHGPGVLFLLLAGYLALSQIREPTRLKGMFFGFSCGFALAIRPTNLLFAGPAMIWMISKQRRFILFSALPLGMIAGGLAAYNQIALGNLSGAEIYQTRFSDQFWNSVRGIMLSPARGLFIYFPPALFGILGYYRAFRDKDPRLSFFHLLALFSLAQILLISKWTIWWGGNSFGPRLLAEIEPMLLLMTIPLFCGERNSVPVRIGFGLAVVWSVMIQSVGAFTDYKSLNWNHFPVHVNLSPDRLWSWSRNPVTWEAGREISKLLGPDRGLIREISDRAESGDAESQVWLGKIYQAGEEIGKNETESVRWYKQAAEMGNPDGEVELALSYRDGRGTAKDESQEMRWLLLAANQGNAAAQSYLGLLYRYGPGEYRDNRQAYRWFEKAALQGDLLGQINLGIIYRDGTGVSRDYRESAKWFLRSAYQNHAKDVDSPVNLGIFYRDGLGVAKNGALAARWFRRAVALGNSDAEVYLGDLYRKGFGVEKDEVRAEEWIGRAARRGNAMAQLNLAWILLGGEGVRQDRAAGMAWLKQAADAGFLPAEVKLGLLYQKGTIIRQDFKESIKWFRKAAEAGDPDAAYLLGRNYAAGIGVAKDFREAFRWFRRSAEEGNADGEFAVGLSYENGLGVTRDRNEALKWYRKAAEQGHIQGERNYRRLGSDVSTGTLPRSGGTAPDSD